MKHKSAIFSSFILIFASAILMSVKLNSEITPETNKNESMTKDDPIRQFGQFVGTWDCDIQNRNSDDSWIEGKATWTWEYILNNQAIQDFWHRPADLENFPKSKDYYGTNVRIYNPEKEKWMITWIETGQMSISSDWSAHMETDGTIKIYDTTNDWLITFFNITKTSFDWKWEFKQEDESMKTMVKIKAKRIN